MNSVKEITSTSSLSIPIPAPEGKKSDKEKPEVDDITFWSQGNKDEVMKAQEKSLRQSIRAHFIESLLGFKLATFDENGGYGAASNSVLYHKQVLIAVEGKHDIKFVAYGWFVSKDKSNPPTYAVICQRTDHSCIIKTFDNDEDTVEYASELSEKKSISISELESEGFQIILK